MAIAQRGLTLEEFLRLPERKPALEFEDGVVTQKVSPKLPHGWLQAKLVELINRSVEPSKRARAFPELRTTFAGSSRVPDVAVYLWERIPRDPNGRMALDATIPPDIAIEIVSPRQSVTALVRRCLRFIQEGVTLAVLVDPQDESIIRFGPGASTSALRCQDRLDLNPVLPGFELVVQDLFDTLKLD
ncbi:MAG TPA: Uma2 family endonuclease [Chloroflexota bacterium]|nr:Uma2 family endonuclease [Chloroflexota bacterium]